MSFSSSQALPQGSHSSSFFSFGHTSIACSIVHIQRQTAGSLKDIFIVQFWLKKLVQLLKYPFDYYNKEIKFLSCELWQGSLQDKVGQKAINIEQVDRRKNTNPSFLRIYCESQIFPSACSEPPPSQQHVANPNQTKPLPLEMCRRAGATTGA